MDLCIFDGELEVIKINNASGLSDGVCVLPRRDAHDNSSCFVAKYSISQSQCTSIYLRSNGYRQIIY